MLHALITSRTSQFVMKPGDTYLSSSTEVSQAMNNIKRGHEPPGFPLHLDVSAGYVPSSEDSDIAGHSAYGGLLRTVAKKRSP